MSITVWYPCFCFVTTNDNKKHHIMPLYYCKVLLFLLGSRMQSLQIYFDPQIREVTDGSASYNIINLTAWGRFETIPAKCDHLPIAQAHFSINTLEVINSRVQHITFSRLKSIVIVHIPTAGIHSNFCIFVASDDLRLLLIHGI